MTGNKYYLLIDSDNVSLIGGSTDLNKLKTKARHMAASGIGSYTIRDEQAAEVISYKKAIQESDE